MANLEPMIIERSALDRVMEVINHPAHYGGDTPYEAIKVIEAWGLGFCLGNAVKYISRAGKKRSAQRTEDLKKAEWYVRRELGGDAVGQHTDLSIQTALELENEALARRIDALEAQLLHQES